MNDYLDLAEDDNGSLRYYEDDKTVTWTFVPRRDRINPRPIPPHEVTLARLVQSTMTFEILPVVTLANSDQYTAPKYNNIRKIVVDLPRLVPELGSPELLEEIMEGLSGAFIKSWQYGLGLTRQYLPIITVIETLSDRSTLHITESTEIFGISETEDSVVLSSDFFDQLCREIRRIDNRASDTALRYKRTFVHNQFAESFGAPFRKFTRGRLPVSQFFSDELSGLHEMTESERNSLIQATSSQARQLARGNPESLASLRLNVDLATIDELIQQFQRALDKTHTESFWQKFFQQNPFSLHLVLGCPLIQVQGQASVGGVKLSGKEARFADFLSKNPLTGNIAIIEIKRPSEKILLEKTYRNTVFPPSKELSGAVGQVLDQRNELSKSLAVLKDNSKIYDIYAYSIRCCVIIGRNPPDADRQKSFESYRGNSSAVDVVTYDELLYKLVQLRDLLQQQAT